MKVFEPVAGKGVKTRVSGTRTTRNERQALREIVHIESFLDFCGYEFQYLQSLRQYCPNHAQLGICGPDVKAEILLKGQVHRTGIEHTEYHVNENIGTRPGSPSRRLRKFKVLLWECIRGGHFTRYPDLENCDVDCEFNTQSLPRESDVGPLADEIVSFLLSRPQGHKRDTSFYPCDFSGFSNLQKYVTRLFVAKFEFQTKQPWFYTSSAWIGIAPEIICKLINDHSNLTNQYDWSGTDERWLLIVASGDVAAVMAGDQNSAYDLESSSVIQSAVTESSYDRVIFWDKISEWAYQIGKGMIRANESKVEYITPRDLE